MKLVLIVLGVLMAASILGFVYIRDPSQNDAILPGCGFKEFTGYHCPGCGGTRSAHALLHGRIGAAFYYNPLFILSLGIGTIAVGRSYVIRKRKITPSPWTGRRSVLLAIAIFVTIVSFWVVRNLSWFPFLRPPALE